MTDYVFDLDGGRPCLDFANTLSTSGDHLNTYADLVAFAVQSNLITPADADWLRERAGARPEQVAEVLIRAGELRAAIYAIFSAIAAGRPPGRVDLDMLNQELSGSLCQSCIVRDDDTGGYRWDWVRGNLSMPLWPIARSAADLLVSDSDRRLVRECSGTECNWLFLDNSKNRSRQWCSMQSCGNREKARRHYQRARAREHVR